MPSLEEIVTELDAKSAGPVSAIVSGAGQDPDSGPNKVNLAEDAAEAFRQMCRDTTHKLAQSSIVPHSAESELGPKQVFVMDDESSLQELAQFRSLADDAATLPSIEPREFSYKIQFYAVAAGRTNRILLVRRTDPKIGYRAGGWLAVGDTQLRKLEEPAFSFSPGFDFLVADAWAVIVNQGPFELLFRETGLVDKHISTWESGITDHLPMEASSRQSLREVARADSRVWRRMREIYRRGHLANVTIEDVAEYSQRMGLDPDKIVQNGQLVFDPGDRFSFLHLLNEDLYRGPLTQQTFEAQRKSPTT